jgi:hypothetical protein
LSSGNARERERESRQEYVERDGRGRAKEKDLRAARIAVRPLGWALLCDVLRRFIKKT